MAVAKSTNLLVRISPKAHLELKVHAAKRGVTMVEFASAAVLAAIAAGKKG